MANPVRTKRHITITYTDGTETFTVSKEAGDLSLDIPDHGVELFLDRGAIAATPDIMKADDAPMTFSHSMYEREWTNGSAATIYAVATNTGYVNSNWTSTIGSSSDATTWTTQIVQEGSDFGASDLTMTLTYCILRLSRADGVPNSWTVNGTSFAALPTIA